MSRFRGGRKSEYQNARHRILMCNIVELVVLTLAPSIVMEADKFDQSRYKLDKQLLENQNSILHSISFFESFQSH